MNCAMGQTVGLISSYNHEPPAGQESIDASLFTGRNVNLGTP